MPVYKDEQRNSWYCKCNYKDWLGESKAKMKRGFSTKKEALQWEREFLEKRSASRQWIFTVCINSLTLCCTAIRSVITIQIQ